MFDRSAISLRIALAVLVLGAGNVAGQEWRDFRAARQAGAVASLDVELLYGAGRLEVGASETPFLYDARLRYDTERFQPLRAWTRSGDHGRLRLGLTSVDDETGPATIRLEDWDVDFDLDDLERRGDELGHLAFELHPGIPTSLKLGVGAADARLELGGLSLTAFELVTGASEASLVFGSPNRVAMKTLSIRAGAATFEAEGLANARFEHFEFAGAIGEVVLDFSGEWRADATASVKMGIGDLKIRVPSEIGVRIRRNSLLIGLDAAGFRKVGKEYFSPNWDTASIRLEIALDAALGTVEVERR